MLAFLFRTLSTSRIRTLSIFLAVFLSSLVIIFFYALYTHIVSAISYYTLDGIDERRFVLTAQTSFFQLLDREKWWLPMPLVAQIENDPDIVAYKEFTFIDIPVLGKFDIFTFSLDIDIPTFAVKQSGTWILDGIGISRSMIRYYNAQFAGSHVMFPVFEDDMIIGRDVSIVFWASKLFSLPENPDATYATQISHIESDYPGFWVVLPYSIAVEKMTRLWKTLTAPYKIVGYMSDVTKRWDIEKRYSGYTISFDQDTIEEKKSLFRTLSQILFFTGGGIVMILYGFLFLLFLWYFREKSYIYALIDQYKVPARWRFVLLFTEPLFLLFFSLGITLIAYISIQPYIFEVFSGFLTSRQIFFPLVPVELGVLLAIMGMNTLIICIYLVVSSVLQRR